jgi:hypothetical protein
VGRSCFPGENLKLGNHVYREKYSIRHILKISVIFGIVNIFLGIANYITALVIQKCCWNPAVAGAAGHSEVNCCRTKTIKRPPVASRNGYLWENWGVKGEVLTRKRLFACFVAGVQPIISPMRIIRLIRLLGVVLSFLLRPYSLPPLAAQKTKLRIFANHHATTQLQPSVRSHVLSGWRRCRRCSPRV